MDNKNVFVAIALSMSVLLFWAAFFETPKQTKRDIPQNQEVIKNKNNITPNVDASLKVDIISREESIKKTKRIKIENNNIIGSLSLRGVF